MNTRLVCGKELTQESRPARMSRFLFRAVPIAALLFFVAWCYISLRPNFSADDAEPEVLNQAWRLAHGESIYHAIDSPPFAFAAYPPLYYALTALLLKFTGLSYLPPKLLSFLSALAICWAMAHLSRIWHGTARHGVWAAFFLFLIPAVFFDAARSNVQMMAVALSVWSLVFFLRDRVLETAVISPLLAVLALYTKQTQVALPVAMIACLALRKREWLPRYLVTAAVAAVIPLIWLQATSDGNYLYNTVQLAILKYDLLQVLPIFLHYAGPIILFIAAALLSSRRRFLAGKWEPLDVYFGCVFLATLIFLGRVGAHAQYVLELVVVTMLVLLRTSPPLWLRGKGLLVPVQILALLIYAPLFIFVEEGLYNTACNRAASRIYPLIEEGSGPILSQQGSFPLFARGEIYVQLFHSTALSRSGIWDQGMLLDKIGKKTFPWVITEFPIESAVLSKDDQERFTPEMVQALRENYRRCEAIPPYYIYRPGMPTETPNLALKQRINNPKFKISGGKQNTQCGS
jgi:hypothetical protein